MTSVRWHPLRNGDPAHTILAVDYGQGRREAAFPELAPNLAVPGAVLVTEFSAAGVAELARAGAVDPEAVRAEIRGWVDQLAEPGTVPRAILSYCAGASLALVLADELEVRGVHVSVVVLDPLVAVPEFLLGRFVEAVRGLAGFLDDPVLETTVREATRETRRTTEITGQAVVECAESLSARYRTVVYQACAAAELDDDAAEELHAHFAGVLHYQAVTAVGATADLWSPARAREISVLLSRRHPPTAPFPATSVFDVDRDSFLADPALAATVSEIIGRYGASGPAAVGSVHRRTGQPHLPQRGQDPW